MAEGLAEGVGLTEGLGLPEGSGVAVGAGVAVDAGVVLGRRGGGCLLSAGWEAPLPPRTGECPGQAATEGEGEQGRDNTPRFVTVFHT